MRVAPLWTVADCRPSNVDKKSVEGQQAVRLCNYTDVYNNQFIDADMDLMEGTAPPDQVERFQVQPGDVLITKDSETNEDIGIPSLVRTAEPGMVCGYHLTLLRPDTEALDPSYLHWWLESKQVKDFWYTNSFGVTRFSLVSPTVWRLPVRLPDLVEQRRIAEYLDRETAEIAVMEAELDRLRERSVVLQTRATLQLGSGATESSEAGSVLEGIPGHWTTTKFGLDFIESTERNGDSPPGPLLSISEYRGVELNERTDGQQASEDVSKYRVVRPGQLAANMMWLNHGGLGVSSLTGYISPDYKAFWISERFYPRYVHYLFRSSRYVDYFDAIGTGVRPNAKRVTKTVLGMMPAPMPPLDEQRRIAAELDAQIGRIDDMIADAQRLKALLAERRSTLITEVVTGRKDVPA